MKRNFCPHPPATRALPLVSCHFFDLIFNFHLSFWSFSLNFKIHFSAFTCDQVQVRMFQFNFQFWIARFEFGFPTISTFPGCRAGKVRTTIGISDFPIFNLHFRHMGLRKTIGILNNFDISGLPRQKLQKTIGISDFPTFNLHFRHMGMRKP